MKHMRKILFGIGILLLILLIQPAAATINVNATEIGTTYIQWTWDGGLNVSDILIDGSVICGYETTNASIILAGLNPSELHSITVLTTTDSGSNSTHTLSLEGGNCTNETAPVCPGPPTLDNATLIYNPDIANVMTNGSSYTSMRLYYAILALFTAFLLSSLFLNGESRPFEKLFMALMAFVTSVVIAISSFSLAIVSFINGGNAQQSLVNGTIFNQQYTIPTIIMQNTPMIEIISCILAVLCFINVINCILTLIEYSRMQNTIDKGVL
jgi:hypothetical protein